MLKIFYSVNIIDISLDVDQIVRCKVFNNVKNIQFSIAITNGI